MSNSLLFFFCCLFPRKPNCLSIIIFCILLLLFCRYPWVPSIGRAPNRSCLLPRKTASSDWRSAPQERIVCCTHTATNSALLVTSSCTKWTSSTPPMTLRPSTRKMDFIIWNMVEAVLTAVVQALAAAAPVIPAAVAAALQQVRACRLSAAVVLSTWTRRRLTAQWLLSGKTLCKPFATLGKFFDFSFWSPSLNINFWFFSQYVFVHFSSAGCTSHSLLFGHWSRPDLFEDGGRQRWVGSEPGPHLQLYDLLHILHVQLPLLALYRQPNHCTGKTRVKEKSDDKKAKDCFFFFFFLCIPEFAIILFNLGL